MKRLLYTAFLIVITIPLTVDAQFYGSGDENFGRGVNRWRNQNSAMSQNISALGTETVVSLPIPVLFGVTQTNLTRNFGEVRSGGHTHEGLDIMSAEGMPVVSPTAAVVVRIASGTSAGNYVSTANSGGETFVYMHLNHVAANLQEGAVLKTGDIIGYVGHTGNAIATAPHLHFEVHNANGDATDPYPRLTTAFSINQKIDFIKTILSNTMEDKKALATLIVQKARGEIQNAVAQNISLPIEITQALAENPSSPTTPSTPITSSTATLKVGSKGASVLALQKFLYKKNIGTGGTIVADGSFGPKTKQAVIEYQRSVGLSADGIAGPKTLAYIAAHP